jgi:CRISPR-associated protein Cmr4
LRASIPSSEKSKKFFLFGNEIDNGEQLEQGTIWIGDGSLLWIPVPSLSHGVVWVTSPMLLRRWQRLSGLNVEIPSDYSTNIAGGNVYLKDAILRRDHLQDWANWRQFVPEVNGSAGISHVLVLPDKHCATIVQMSLWRQVKVKLNEHKTVEGGFRYEEAIPPDTIMYFPWGITAQANGTCQEARREFTSLLQRSDVLQIGGQESLGRGFVQLTFNSNQDTQAGAS